MDGIIKHLSVIYLYFSCFFNGNNFYVNGNNLYANGNNLDVNGNYSDVNGNYSHVNGNNLYANELNYHWTNIVSNFKIPKTHGKNKQFNNKRRRFVPLKRRNIGNSKNIVSGTIKSNNPSWKNPVVWGLLVLNGVFILYIPTIKKKISQRFAVSSEKSLETINNSHQWQQLKEKYSIKNLHLDGLMVEYLKQFPQTHIIQGMENKIIEIEKDVTEKEKQQQEIESVINQTVFFLNMAIKINNIFQLFDQSNILKSFKKNSKKEFSNKIAKKIIFQRRNNYINCNFDDQNNQSVVGFNGSFLRFKNLNIIFLKKKNDIESNALLLNLIRLQTTPSIEEYLDCIIDCLKTFMDQK
jgi:hypothetical protein